MTFVQPPRNFTPVYKLLPLARPRLLRAEPSRMVQIEREDKVIVIGEGFDSRVDYLC